MKNKFIAKASVEINAPASEVWEALTDPEKVKQYLFGTTVETDWKVGSPIIWKGEWQGKAYEDKGTVLKFEPNKIIETTYWSSMSGTEDKPENYVNVSYKLEEKDNKTLLTVTQDNINEENSAKHSGENWKMVLEKLKDVVENES